MKKVFEFSREELMSVFGVVKNIEGLIIGQITYCDEEKIASIHIEKSGFTLDHSFKLTGSALDVVDMSMKVGKYQFVVEWVLSSYLLEVPESYDDVRIFVASVINNRKLSASDLGMGSSSDDDDDDDDDDFYEGDDDDGDFDFEEDDDDDE